jgi:hypothetical protein
VLVSAAFTHHRIRLPSLWFLCSCADGPCPFLTGLLGKIKLPTNYNHVAPGTNAYPRCNGKTSPQVRSSCFASAPV